jgi:crossover junction endodeoxyribonuclease RusA
MKQPKALSETIAFTVLGTPRPQGSMRVFMSGGKPHVTGDNPKTKPWRNAVADAALEAGAAPWVSGVPVRLTAVCYFKRPRKAPKSRIHPSVKPDADKLLRAIGDALSGVAYHDDAQIVAVNLEKRYGLPERAEITVEVLR